MLAVGVRPRSIDKHADLAGRVHDIFANGLFLLQGENDIVQASSAVDVLVNIIAFALVGDVVIVHPASKAFLGLQEKAVEDLVRIGFHEIWRIMRLSNPSLHCNRILIVLGRFAARHGVVYAAHMPRAILLDIGNSSVGVWVAIGFSFESGASSTVISRFVGSVEQLLEWRILGLPLQCSIV